MSRKYTKIDQQTKEGVLYLSMIRDLYDRSVVAYKTSNSQTVSLVLDTIHLAMKSVKAESRRDLLRKPTR